ncbi:MAG: hypothetical protein L6R30_16170 [Thermoanaerobaculia bacterium]|nr:hypothetical protein [Thermoanaerobaculia bacterium]
MSTDLLRRFLPSRLFRMVRPSHAFVLTRNRLVYVGQRPGKKGAKETDNAPVFMVSRPLPEGALKPGPRGIPVAGKEMDGVVSRLAQDIGAKITATSLCIPDDFVRVISVDVDAPEKNPKEVNEILRWKFAKMFGDTPPPLRIAWQTAGPGSEGGTRVLAMATLEETAASLEDSFQKAGIRVGALESAAVAVSYLGKRALPQGRGFVLWADGDAATTVFFREGRLRFLRTKATSDPDEALQEIRLAASFVAQGDKEEVLEQPLDVAEPCAAGPLGSPIISRFRAFRAEQGGRDPQPITKAALFPATPVVSGAAVTDATLAGVAGVEDPALLVALGAMASEA